MGINDRNSTDDYDNAYSVIRGHDNLYSAKVDNENRLWVNSKQSVVPTGLNGLNKKLRYLDCNVSNGGVARDTVITGTTWVDVFSYTGNGYFLFLILNLETSSDWEFRAVIDSNELFGNNGITSNDIVSNSLYDLDTSGKSFGDIDNDVGLFIGDNDKWTLHPPLGLPLYFESSIVFKIKRRTGASTKKFRAGLVSLTQGF